MQNIVMAAAVIYVPAGHPIDRHLAHAYWAYIQRRGYEFYSVVRDLRRALEDLAAGDAQVIVMVGPEAAPRVDPGCSTVVDLRAKRDRMLADEPTVRLRPRAEQLLDDARVRWAKAANNSWPH